MGIFRSVSSLSSVLKVLFLVVIVVDARKASDHNQPHPHKGMLKAYKPGPFDVKLSSKDEQNLEKGHAVMKQTQDSALGGGAICVQDVQAPPAAVWNQILDLNSYKGKVPKVVQSKNYFNDGDKQKRRFKTKMVLGVLPGYSYESYYDHTFHARENSLTWTLDYEKTSDFDDVAGHWHVEPLPGDASKSRVFYACDIKLHGKVPGPILNYLSKAALKQATGWVKRESEKQSQASLPKPFADMTNNMQHHHHQQHAATAAKAAVTPKKRRFAFSRE